MQTFQGEPIQKRTYSYSPSSSSSTLADHKVTWVLIFCFSYRGILSLFIWRHCRNSINNFWLNDQYKRFIFRKRSNLSCWTEKDKQSFICQQKRFLINWRHLPESFHRQIISNIIMTMSMETKFVRNLWQNWSDFLFLSFWGSVWMSWKPTMIFGLSTKWKPWKWVKR